MSINDKDRFCERGQEDQLADVCRGWWLIVYCDLYYRKIVDQVSIFHLYLKRT